MQHSGYSESVADVVRHGRLRWFGHLEHKEDWGPVCRNFEGGAKRMNRGRKEESIRDLWILFEKSNDP